MSNITPLPGYVLIKDTKQTIGGFELASNDKEREAMIGEVVEVAPNVKLSSEVTSSFNLKDMLTMGNATSINKGETIIYRKYHSESFEWGGESYRMVSIDDV